MKRTNSFRRRMACAFAFCGLFLTLPSLIQAADIGGLRMEGKPGWQVTDDFEPMLSWIPLVESSGQAMMGYEVVASKSRGEAMAGDGTWWKSEFIPVGDGPRVILDAQSLPSRAEIWVVS